MVFINHNSNYLKHPDPSLTVFVTLRYILILPKILIKMAVILLYINEGHNKKFLTLWEITKGKSCK